MLCGIVGRTYPPEYGAAVASAHAHHGQALLGATADIAVAPAAADVTDREVLVSLLHSDAADLCSDVWLLLL